MESLCVDDILNSISDKSILERIKNTSFSFLEVNNYEYQEEKNHIDSIGFDAYLEEQSPVLNNIEDDPSFKLHYKRKIFNNIRSNMSNIYSKKDDKDSKILFFFSSLPPNNSTLKFLCCLLIKLECKEAVILNEKTPSPSFIKSCEKLNSSSNISEDVFNIIPYTDNKFIDISNHVYSPKILEIYRNSSVDEFLIKNNIKNKYIFPRILISDPLVKFYKCKKGDIIKFERESGIRDSLIDKEIFYRIVSNN